MESRWEVIMVWIEILAAGGSRCEDGLCQGPGVVTGGFVGMGDRRGKKAGVSRMAPRFLAL